MIEAKVSLGTSVIPPYPIHSWYTHVVVDYKKIRGILKDPEVDINYRDESGQTALVIATLCT